MTIVNGWKLWTIVARKVFQLTRCMGSRSALVMDRTVSWISPTLLTVNEYLKEPWKKISNNFEKNSLLLKTVLESEAGSLSPTVQLDFRWTHEMSDRQNDRFTRPSESLSNSLNTMCSSWELSHRIFFCQSINFKIKYCKKFHCHLTKISLHYQTVLDQRLTAFHQVFSWTSARPSKCPIHKMIGLQGHLTVWILPWLSYLQAKSSITENIFQMNNFSN